MFVLMDRIQGSKITPAGPVQLNMSAHSLQSARTPLTRFCHGRRLVLGTDSMEICLDSTFQPGNMTVVWGMAYSTSQRVDICSALLLIWAQVSIEHNSFSFSSVGFNLTIIICPGICRYHLRDIVVGKIYFLLVRIKIKHMEIAIIKKETSGSRESH